MDVLLRSGAHAYLEFKAVECVALLGQAGAAGGGELRPIPASRAEVFSSTLLSPADKRALMRTLKAAGTEEEGASALFPADTPFATALREAGLSEPLADAEMYGIALLESAEGVSAAEGAAAIRRYLSSLGRFSGAGALLAPLYGASELPQAFCRTAVRFCVCSLLRASLTFRARRLWRAPRTCCVGAWRPSCWKLLLTGRARRAWCLCAPRAGRS